MTQLPEARPVPRRQSPARAGVRPTRPTSAGPRAAAVLAQLYAEVLHTPLPAVPAPRPAGAADPEPAP